MRSSYLARMVGRVLRALQQHARRRGGARLVLESLGLLLAGLCTLILIILAKARHTPQWWDDVRAQSTTLEPTRGERVENALLGELTRVRPLHADRDDMLLVSDPWTLRVEPHEVQAWVEQRLPKWMENQGITKDAVPALGRVRDLRVLAKDGLAIGVEVRDAPGQGSRVLWARVEPSVQSDGSLWLTTHEIGVGSLRLPRTVLDNAWIEQGPFVPTHLASDPSFLALLRVLRGEAPAMKQATLRCDAHRRVRILAIATTPQGATTLTLRTEAVKRP